MPPIARLLAVRVALAAPAAMAAFLVLASWSLAQLDERRYPPAGALPDIDGRTLHVLDLPALGAAVNAPALLLLHGGGTSLEDLRAGLAPALQRRGFRTLLMDRPGHGYSEAGDDDIEPDVQATRLASALRALDADGAIWIAHSRAAAVALARLHQQPVTAVLIAGLATPSADAPPPHVGWLTAPVLGPLFAWTAIETLGRLAVPTTVASAFAPEPVPDGYVQDTALPLSLRPAAARHDARERLAVQRWLADDDIAARSVGGARVLAIVAAEDRIVPPRQHLPALRERVPQLSHVTLAGAGHGLLHTRTDAVADAISDFVLSSASSSSND